MNVLSFRFTKIWFEVMEKRIIKINSPSDCEPVLSGIRYEEKENFVVILLNGNHEVQKVETVSIGILNRAIIHPREVFKPAIINCSASIIIAHNHPSGNIEPSREDRDITHRLKEAGELLGIEVLDHVIVSKRGYYSFLEEGEM